MRGRPIKPWIKTTIKLMIGVGALVLISKSGHLNWGLLAQLFTQWDTAFVLLLLAGLNIFAQALRWWIILLNSFPEVSLYRTTQFQLIGSFFNYVFPSSVGGDILRAFYIAQEKKELRLRAIFTVIVDRVIGLYSLIFVSSVFLYISKTSSTIQSLKVSVWGLFIGFTIFFIMVGLGLGRGLVESMSVRLLKGKPFLMKTYDQLQGFIRDFKTFTSTFVLGVVNQFFAVYFFYWIATHSDMTHATFVQLLSVVPLGFLAMSLPISPAGVGVGQVAYLFLIEQIVGETNEFGPTAISAFQLAVLLWSFLGGWFYLTLKKPQHVSENLEEELNG